MSAALFLRNLELYSLQVAAVVLTAAIAAAVFRVRTPGPRLVYWQIVLVACLILPIAQSWIPAQAGGDEVGVVIGAARTAEAPARGGRLPFERAAAAVILGGAALRLAWLAAGFLKLRSLRRGARPADPPPAAVEEARRIIGVHAPALFSGRVSGPVALGVFKPAILLPDSFAALSGDAQCAVACHEFLHVRRRDTLVVVGEELVRAVLWFHPAVWWMLGQIHLAREQAVDREAVRLTGSRQSYLSALLAMAQAKVQPDLPPAPLFLRKRHLEQRVSFILKEVVMSKRRLISSLAAMFGLVLAAARVAIVAFPLQAAPQEAAGPRVLHKAPVVYPQEAKQKKIEGTVAVEVSLDAKGKVLDARAVSGPEELRAAALRSVLDSHYANESGTPRTVTATVDFRLREAPEAVSRGIASRPADLGRVERIQIEGIPEEARQRLQSRLPVQTGDLLTAGLQERIREIVHDADEHLGVSFSASAAGGAVVKIGLSETGAPLRVGGNAQAAKIVTRVPPVYPPEAKKARLEGSVRLSVLIAKDGTAREVKVESGEAVLAASAVGAVRQWVWKPTLLNGDAVEVLTVVDVNYTLAK